VDPTQWGAPYPIVLLALFVIVMARANGTYWLGRVAAAGARRSRLGRLMESAGYNRAREQLNTWGAPAVCLSFLTIGVQTLVNLAAGATRMPLNRYLPAVTIGAVIWSFLYATVGFVGVEALAVLYAFSPVVALTFGVGGAAILVWFIVRQFRQRLGIEVKEAPQER
jgi:membrane protein DedA with SNARE-associated domain